MSRDTLDADPSRFTDTVDRRRALKGIGAAAAATGVPVLASSPAAATIDDSGAWKQTLRSFTECQTVTPSDYAWVTDYRFELSYLGVEGSTYYFSAATNANQYAIQNGTDYCNGNGTPDSSHLFALDKLRYMDLDATIYNNQGSTSLNTYTSRTRGGALTTSEWGNWKANNQGSVSDLGDVEAEFEANDFDEPEIPTWVEGVGLLAGLYTGASQAAAAVEMGTLLFDGLLFASKVSTGDVNCTKDLDSSPDHFNWTWDWCYERPQASYAVKFSVTLDESNQTEDVDLYVDENFYVTDEIDDNGSEQSEWLVTIPADGSDPYLVHRYTLG